MQRQLSPAADKPLWAHSGSDYAGPSRAPHAVADCGRLTRCSAFPWSDDDRTAACRPASSPSSQTNGDLRASGDARRLPRHVPRYRYRDELAALTAPSSIAAARESGAAQHFRLVAVSGINRNRAAPLGEQGSPARSVKPSGERERAARRPTLRWHRRIRLDILILQAHAACDLKRHLKASRHQFKDIRRKGERLRARSRHVHR